MSEKSFADRLLSLAAAYKKARELIPLAARVAEQHAAYCAAQAGSVSAARDLLLQILREFPRTTRLDLAREIVQELERD